MPSKESMQEAKRIILDPSSSSTVPIRKHDRWLQESIAERLDELKRERDGAIADFLRVVRDLEEVEEEMDYGCGLRP